MRDCFSRWRTTVVLLLLTAFAAMARPASAGTTSGAVSVGDLTVTPERAPPWVTDLSVLTNAYNTTLDVTLAGADTTQVTDQIGEQMRHSTVMTTASEVMGLDLRGPDARSYALLSATGLGTIVAFTLRTGVRALNKGPVAGLEPGVGMLSLG